MSRNLFPLKRFFQVVSCVCRFCITELYYYIFIEVNFDIFHIGTIMKMLVVKLVIY